MKSRLKNSLDPIDVYVGRRVCERRQERALTLADVAQHLGVTFQAVQWYERGGHRIAASTLYRIAQILNVAPGYFFEGYSEPITETKGQARKAGW